MTEERRRYARHHDLLALVHVSRGRCDVVMEIINLSRGGALIDIGSLRRPVWIEPGREVNVRVLAPDGSVLIETAGRVVRIVENLDSRTFAIEFDAVQDEVSIRRACRVAGKPPPLPMRARAI